MQTLLFSATIPKQLAEFARAGLHEPEMIRLDVEHSISDKLKVCWQRDDALEMNQPSSADLAVWVARQQNIFLTVRSQEKVAALLWIIEDVLPADQQCMVFAATRHHVDFLVEILRKVSCLLDQAHNNQRARSLTHTRSAHAACPVEPQERASVWCDGPSGTQHEPGCLPCASMPHPGCH